MFLKIFALVKVIDEFDMKILANLVNSLYQQFIGDGRVF